MNQLRISAILLLLWVVAPFAALADSFKASPADLGPGKTATLQFVLENTQDFYGFQAEVKLPDGLEAVKGNDGDLDVVLSERAKDGKYEVNSNLLSGNTLIMGAFSANHIPFSGNDGVLVDLKVSVADTFKGGKVEISNIYFINSKDEDVALDATATILGVAATGISLSETAAELEVGETTTLTATVAPESTTDKTVAWISSDEAVATVDANGKVTAKALGEATVTATCGAVSASCKVTVVPTPVESITLSTPALTLTIGDKADLTATVAPGTATDKTVSWTSSDTSVATVTASGEVTAVKEGSATITATSSNGKTAACTVSVKTDVIAVTSISISETELTLTEGEKAALTAAVAPSNATDTSVTWTTSDAAVATVSATGEVVAVKAGTATITAASSNGKSAICNVTVKPLIIAATGVTLNLTASSLMIGESVALTATVAPENTTDKTVTWKSSDEAVATVDANGKVTAKSLGEATISATCGGASAACKVTVIPTPVESVILDRSEATLTEGETLTLKATVAPADATDKSVTWTSSDETVATVDCNGKVTAVKAGTATITAKAGEKSVVCALTVKPLIIAATGVTLNLTTSSLKVGESIALAATVAPENTTDKTVGWKSSDEAVATVDANGKVTAKALGEATITATCGAVSGSCKVTVIPTPVESVVLDKREATLTEGETLTLTAAVGPDDATDKSVSWTSSDETVATVDANGKVTAVREGTATVIAKAGAKSAACIVTVNPLIVEATGVTLNLTTSSLKVGETVTLTATVTPENATDKTVAWKSSNEAVATVDANGKVTAKALGEATITAVCGAASGTCKVTVIPTPVESVVLDRSEALLTKGGTVTLTATVAPADATDKSVVWSSSNEKIATVDQEGKVTAVGGGEATITATSAADAAIKASCTVKVTVPVTGLEVQDEDHQPLANNALIELHTGDNYDLTAVVMPADATEKTVVWTTSDEEVAEVDSNGLIETHKAGEAVIKAEIAGFSFELKVNVTDPEIPITGLTLDSTAAEMLTGATLQLTAKITPAEATSKEVGWKSSDTSIATVDRKGLVTALKAGKVTITATANKITASCEITITDPYFAVTGITLDRTDIEGLTEGESVTLTATVEPENATEPHVTWSSSDENVATVTQEGVVTAVAAGQAVITAKAGGKTAECKVTVKIRIIDVTAIAIDKTAATLTIGENITLVATVAPENATDKTVRWTSSDEKIASVDQAGKVTANAQGEVTITAEAGGKKAECVIKVIVHVTGISISKDVVELVKGSEIQLSATVAPENADEKGVVWISSDEKVATVDQTGKVTATGGGEATITVTSASNAAIKASCAVKVTVPVTGLEVQDEDHQPLDNNAVIELHTGDNYDLTAVVKPADATERTVVWTSSDEEVAEVDANGLIETHKAGEAVIKAEIAGFSFATTVVVTDPVIPITGVTLDRTTAEMKTGSTLQLTATIAPVDASSKEVGWKSSDTSIATVDRKGLVTALKAGKVTITATANKITATCEITITDIEVTGVTLNVSEIKDLMEGESVTLTATVEPDNATDKTVVWTSSDEKIATVTQEGLVTAVAPGDVTITATAGKASATCTISVIARPIAVEGISLSESEVTLTEGDDLTLLATVLPADATDKTVTWTSSDETIASVDRNGKVTAHAAGKAVITAQAADKTATCVITVKPAVVEVIEITLDQTDAKLMAGDTLQLTATVSPEDATDTTVTWTSSNESVATVDHNGKVTAVAVGSATITAQAGGKTAECTVTVNKSSAVESFGFDSEAPIKVFDLNGLYVSDSLDDLQQGYYIIRQGDTVKKICIR